MSLMLRKYCQPTLFRAGLGDYHVNMDAAKNMVVSGECGKPLLTITGITFPKPAPTKVEIEYAEELLVTFLQAHKGELDRYIKLHNKFISIPIPAEEVGTMKIKISNAGYPVVYKYRAFYDDGPIVFTMSEDKLNPSPHALKDSTAIVELEQYTLDTSMYTRYAKHFKKYLAWKKIEKELEELREDLSSCDI